MVEGLQHLSDLRVFNLAGNCVEHVKNLCGLTSLVELNLRRNRIQTAVSVSLVVNAPSAFSLLGFRVVLHLSNQIRPEPDRAGFRN